MLPVTLAPEPLSRENFAPFGEVIECRGTEPTPMNGSRFALYSDLCRIDIDHGARIAVRIAKCLVATELPLRVAVMERHPLGSQAFVPLTPAPMVLVVAPPGITFCPRDLRAFVSDGAQGINYGRGTWHMPLIGFREGQRYLVIDRHGDGSNCESRELDCDIVISA